MRIIETTVYEFDELNDEAKERARAWYREGALDYDWWDYLYEDAERIGLRITGFDLGGRKHIEGELTRSVEEICQAIMREHGKSCDTYKLAEQWVAKSATLQNAIDGLDDKGADNERERLEEEQKDNKDEFRQALLEEYFTLLNGEYEYLLSDEQVDESIRCNAYTFTEEGERKR